ncbi:hypothetical protein [uncultured Dokdonia sp.]|uniref:hypothetical protein n=1 Tax=uncultured Dokdonia sp. TaxID=575653 RepID=UPI00260B903A|nr:hypothetical protein [uncultured Dokdonia sp.]
MKLVISSFTIIATIIMSSCGGHKNATFEKEGTLSFKEATYSKWVAGIKGGGAGYNIKLLLDPTHADIKLDSIYFKDFSASLISNGDGLYTSFIDNGQNREVLSPIYKRTPEVTEAPSKKNLQTLFELTGDNAVVSYLKNGNTVYYKVTLTPNRSINLPR